MCQCSRLVNMLSTRASVLMEKEEYYDCEDKDPRISEFVDAQEETVPSVDAVVTDETASPSDEYAVDEAHLRELEELMSNEEKQDHRLKALEMKQEGNSLFAGHQWEEAAKSYTKAIIECPPSYPDVRAVIYSNRAACFIKMEQNEQAVIDCSKAIELDPSYAKAYFRRAQLYENNEETWDKALDDYQTSLRLQPDNNAARAAIMRLPSMIADRNERMKADMMDKLKDLGNTFLRPFGLSTDSFKLEPTDGGGYTIQMKK